MEKVIKNGKVGVLVSPGYGAGFSTWGYPEEAIFDPTLIEMVEKKYNMEYQPNEKGGITQIRKVWDSPEYKQLTDDMIKYCETKWEAYSGGVQDLEVVWVSEGSEFIIEEYDGSESLMLKENYNWLKS